MINIEDKRNCCGCSSCAQSCPVSCISMQPDAEGFLYPVVDLSRCIDCGLCEKVCPFIQAGEKRLPAETLAAMNKDDEVRQQSSSGGVFSALAESVIREGGVVFGVRFNDRWQPVFDYAENMDGIFCFRGSKYVQATVGTAYRTAKTFLNAGRKVLFTGTPCQIAGLRHFLRKDYANLLAVEVVCHGTPSPLVWSDYLKDICRPDRREGFGKNTVLSFSKDIPEISGISFRDKKLGWKKYSFVVWGKSAADGQNSVLLSDKHPENRFMRAFLCNLILRPSCYTCKVRSGKSGADLAMADYWGVSRFHPELDDDRGTSLVLVYSQKGRNALESVSGRLVLANSKYENAVKGNPSIEKSGAVPKCRGDFWKEYDKQGIAIIDSFYEKLRPSLLKRYYYALRHRIANILRRN